jgi:hypothetical protein
MATKKMPRRSVQDDESDDDPLPRKVARVVILFDGDLLI